MITAMLVLWASSGTLADIYLYVNENGVRCFTDKKPAAKHTVFIKTPATATYRSKIVYRAPQSYDAIIAKAARKHGVASALIKSVIQAESAFDPTAISPRGAQGLMQIMPANLKALAVRDPFDPQQNIMGGTRYLKQMLQRYDNNMKLALAAYNAGPGAVDRHNHSVPPFDETRAYVNKVIRLYQTYKRSL
jgi:soluble lytic murein transglycosylase